MSEVPSVRLTEFAHGGGCGCKLAPALLQRLLADQPELPNVPQLLVGTETGDDAAVWQLDSNTCVVATTDFFTPVVDDPRDFGRIAATNALSDVYAMGARPIFALAILGMPLGRLPVEVVRQILAGGREVCAAAGIPVAGGHSIDTPEPIYGLAVTGICHPSQVRRNAGARFGDALILTKPIGIGIYSNALRHGALDAAGYSEMLAVTTLLNQIGTTLGDEPAVHAMTDVTGFGLLGHGLEMARGAQATLHIDAAAVPLLRQTQSLLQAGHLTGASQRNWDSYGAEVVLSVPTAATDRVLLTDPQTSGGLLVACAADAAERLLALIRAAGHAQAAIIGNVEPGEPRLVVTRSVG